VRDENFKIVVRLNICDKCHRLTHSFDGHTFRLRHGIKCKYSTLTNVGTYR